VTDRHCYFSYISSFQSLLLSSLQLRTMKKVDLSGIQRTKHYPIHRKCVGFTFSLRQLLVDFTNTKKWQATH